MSGGGRGAIDLTMLLIRSVRTIEPIKSRGLRDERWIRVSGGRYGGGL